MLQSTFFRGPYGSISIAGTVGLDIGGTLSIARAGVRNNYILGLGATIGAGIPFPGPVTGNAGFGISTIWPLK